jgi:hypothetical protein
LLANLAMNASKEFASKLAPTSIKSDQLRSDP